MLTTIHETDIVSEEKIVARMQQWRQEIDVLARQGERASSFAALVHGDPIWQPFRELTMEMIAVVQRENLAIRNIHTRESQEIYLRCQLKIETLMELISRTEFLGNPETPRTLEIRKQSLWNKMQELYQRSKERWI